MWGARAAQKATGRNGKYTELLRAKLGLHSARREPVHVEPSRRLAAHLRADFGADGEKTARLVDAAVTWTVKGRELKHVLLRAPGDPIRAPSLRPG
ncbi:hypothetical protein [Streptomyces sp. NPDC059787]|uniref:hypothetical protein n=1 Tax=Streptomyces sp. NPDC059787 TaxID=3346947 RepID=UPI00364C0941